MFSVIAEKSIAISDKTPVVVTGALWKRDD